MNFVDDLKNLARINNLKGYSNLKKEQLADLLAQNLHGGGATAADDLKGLSPSQAQLLGIISQRQGGRGLSITVQAEFLQRFSRKTYKIQKSNQKHYAGTGLGLYLCKKVIDAHRGRISVESTEHVGSKFTILLPISHLR